MAADDESFDEFIAGLSSNQREALMEALQKVEWRLYQGVLRRLRVWLTVFISALTLFGIAALSTVRTALVDTAANKLAIDSDLRNEVVNEAAKKLQRVNEVIANANRLQRDIDAERGRALAVVRADLSQIVSMTAQLQGDVESERSTSQPRGKGDPHVDR